MKTFKNTLLLATGLLIFAACNDEVAIDEPTAVLSENDAFEMLEESLSEQNAGLVLELDILSADMDAVLDGTETLPGGRNASPPSDFCGETQSKSKSGSFEGPNVSWSYQWDWSRTLFCDDNQKPSYFDVTLDANRSFANNIVTSEGTVDGDWTVTFEQDDFFIKVYNGDYIRELDRQAVQNDRGHVGKLDVNIVDVKVRRADRFILEGTLYFTLSGENNSGNTFSKSGEVIFNGDCTATITLDTGESRTITICN